MKPLDSFPFGNEDYVAALHKTFGIKPSCFQPPAHQAMARDCFDSNVMLHTHSGSSSLLSTTTTHPSLFKGHLLSGYHSAKYHNARRQIDAVSASLSDIQMSMDYNRHLLDWRGSQILMGADDELILCESKGTRFGDYHSKDIETIQPLHRVLSVSNKHDYFSAVKWTSAPGLSIVIKGLTNSPTDHALIAYDFNTEKTWTSWSLPPFSVCGQLGCLDWKNNVAWVAGKGDECFAYDLRQHKWIQRLHVARGHQIVSIACHPTQELLIVGTSNCLSKGDVIVFDLFTQQKLIHARNIHEGGARAVEWNPVDSNLFATGGGTDDGRLLVWNVRNLENPFELCKTETQITDLFWSLDGRSITTTHNHGATCHIMDWSYGSSFRMQSQYGIPSDHISPTHHRMLPGSRIMQSAVNNMRSCMVYYDPDTENLLAHPILDQTRQEPIRNNRLHKHLTIR